MKRRPLSGTDLTVSRIGLGTATWGTSTRADDAARQLSLFIDAGGKLVDTADIYGGGRSEQIIGQLIGRVVARTDIVLTTKAGAVPGRNPFRIDASPRHLLSALDASLGRLRTDYIDLWQLHAWDAATPIDDTLEAISRALQSGRARCAGVCNYCGWQLAKAASRRVPLASCQVEYSLLERGVERELIPAALDAEVNVLAWGPLGRGVLTGKYVNGVPASRARSRFFQWYIRHHLDAERTPSIMRSLTHVADEMGVPPLAVSLAWVRDRPAVAAAIVGARTAEQLEESLAGEDLELPEALRRRLDDVSAPSIGYPERGLS